MSSEFFFLFVEHGKARATRNLAVCFVQMTMVYDYCTLYLYNSIVYHYKCVFFFHKGRTCRQSDGYLHGVNRSLLVYMLTHVLPTSVKGTRSPLKLSLNTLLKNLSPTLYFTVSSSSSFVL